MAGNDVETEFSSINKLRLMVWDHRQVITWRDLVQEHILSSAFVILMPASKLWVGCGWIPKRLLFWWRRWGWSFRWWWVILVFMIIVSTWSFPADVPWMENNWNHETRNDTKENVDIIQIPIPQSDSVASEAYMKVISSWQWENFFCCLVKSVVFETPINEVSRCAEILSHFLRPWTCSIWCGFSFITYLWVEM